MAFLDESFIVRFILPIPGASNSISLLIDTLASINVGAGTGTMRYSLSVDFYNEFRDQHPNAADPHLTELDRSNFSIP
jgi:hypothetical protein